MPLAEFDAAFPLLTAALRRTRAEHRLVGAYLISGGDAELRAAFATAVAQAALCPEATAGEACGVCLVCRQLASGAYPDLQTLMPVSKSRQILIGEDEDEPDTLRWFRAFFHLGSSGRAGVKVGIIHDADCLNLPAQNAFLKVLEEPPGPTLFLLLSAHPMTLLPTIRSRCQRLPLLRQRCTYSFPGVDKLSGLLRRLDALRPRDLAGAAASARELCAMAGELEEVAASLTANAWQERLAAAKEGDARIRKHLEERHKAAARAAYLRLREHFLSCIHARYAQLFMLATGADQRRLPNPELLDAADFAVTDEVVAAGRLRAADELLNNLSWNVRDDLALTSFCLAVAGQSSSSPETGSCAS